jgi:hypothetical protein
MRKPSNKRLDRRPRSEYRIVPPVPFAAPVNRGVRRLRPKLAQHQAVDYYLTMDNIPESDWKYLRDLKGELLDTLCKRINEDASQIIAGQATSQHEKYLRLFRHVSGSNEIIARCFDDWRRSNIILKVLSLREEGLLTDKHIMRLTEKTQGRIS